MKTINNLSQENLQRIASEVSGKLWMKNGKIRIYVEGGNNYHYDGSWYYEIDEDGSWEAKCYLTKGYNNSNREEYVSKYLRGMRESMDEVLNNESGDVIGVEKVELEFNQELEDSLKCPAVPILKNENYNPKNTPVKRVALLAETPMIKFYHGAKKYRVYVKDNCVIGMTSNLNKPSNEPDGVTPYIVDGSCTELCFNF